MRLTVAMTNAHPTSKHKPSVLTLASGLHRRSGSSSRGPTNVSQPDVRSSLELQTLLRSSNEDGRGQPPIRNEKASAEESDEEENNTRSMSRVTSLSKSYTAEEEKAIIRKFDRRLVLFVALLYMLSFLDRSSQAFDIPQYPTCHSLAIPNSSLCLIDTDILYSQILGMRVLLEWKPLYLSNLANMPGS